MKYEPVILHPQDMHFIRYNPTDDLMRRTLMHNVRNDLTNGVLDWPIVFDDQELKLGDNLDLMLNHYVPHVESPLDRMSLNSSSVINDRNMFERVLDLAQKEEQYAGKDLLSIGFRVNGDGLIVPLDQRNQRLLSGYMLQEHGMAVLNEKEVTHLNGLVYSL